MRWEWIILVLAVLLIVAFLLFPGVHWDGQKAFILTLSASAANDTAALFYCQQFELEQGRQLCDSYRKEKASDIEPMFRPVTLAADGKFTIEVSTFGNVWFWGLWRESRMFEYVILMGKMKTGERVFTCVSVKSTEPIDLK
jgi:hypothetical protein